MMGASRIRASLICASPDSGNPDRATRSRSETYVLNASLHSRSEGIPDKCEAAEVFACSPLGRLAVAVTFGGADGRCRSAADLNPSMCVAISRRTSVEDCIPKRLD